MRLGARASRPQSRACARCALILAFFHKGAYMGRFTTKFAVRAKAALARVIPILAFPT